MEGRFPGADILNRRFESEADEGLVGDLFTAVFDGLPKWSFRKTPLVSAISRRFDYKAERQQRK